MNHQLTHSDLCDAITALARAQSNVARGECDQAADDIQLGIERALVAMKGLCASGHAPTLRTFFAERLHAAAEELEQSEAPQRVRKFAAVSAATRESA